MNQKKGEALSAYLLRATSLSICFGFIFLAVPCFSQEWKELLVKNLESEIKKQGFKKSDLGLYISYAGENAEVKLLDLNAEKKFTPASLTKIVTAGAILERFPVGHKFVTRLQSKAPREAGVLKGDLYLNGGGDAGFVSETMWYLVNEFLRTDIKIIEGDIVVDDSRFDQVRFDPGRDPSRVDRAYDAPIGAMTFNWSAANVFVRPGDETGDPVKVYLDPANEYLGLSNKAKTALPGTSPQLQVSREETTRKVSASQNFVDKIVVTGQMGVDQKETVFYKSISKPGLWAGYNLVSFLKQRGVTVRGSVRLGVVPKGAATLADVDSRPLPELVAGMMKFSNNYIAEIMTKNLAAELKGTPASMETGLGVIRDYVHQLGIKPGHFAMTNPSGLSRRNNFRPRDLHTILVHLKNSFRIYPELASALPIAGVDGTLEKRLKDTNAEGLLRAKTGHLTGVSGLAGYVGRPDGRQFTFVFLYNGKANKTFEARRLFDRFAETLAGDHQ
ncbi:MAG: D-alanyl-D-alanine carboxypeptidase/D-alanyl-D-alanine-endopeptidase [Pseudobdellovibrionaceae bacterium]|nr:D-alanyl-D-alanine carboxypeptidase/D-alanyl-D-alanine-endopeptidase [Bdellovibrionales bacterium]USN46406.1 MAG: D-alanyl-D-alanine carboxypeptidase/D-alanyl-D-alanine-endopeptidase [Pseudobdellovibrionaceae bacterium]